MTSAGEKIMAFFSYAHADWHANEEELGHLFEQLERQITAHTAGSFAFTKWQDTDRLRWGDRWRDVLSTVISDCQLFFLFLSPGWLASEVCHQEFAAFVQRQNVLGGQRVFVAYVRDLDEREQKKYSAFLSSIDEFQAKYWQCLLNTASEARKMACDNAAKEVKAQLRVLYPERDSIRPTEKRAVPVDNHDSVVPLGPRVKVASGDFFIPRPEQRGDSDEPIPVSLRVLFCGWAKVSTEHGCFVFGVKAALLHVDVEGGRLKTHPEFAGASRSPAVIPIGGVSSQYSYQIVASSAVLRGNVLTNEDDHVPIVRIDRLNGGDAVRVSGMVAIDTDGLSIDEQRSRPKKKPSSLQDADKIEAMRQKIASVLLQESGSLFVLEGAEA